ncbi:MAG TPA: aminoacyl-tRNA hydrolase [Acidimicrobiales bacterium]|jgi:peptidyl-tRNA hydrolase, PTH1 family|nr:aminoacyl-tRNA hydrolase [Acidimicrobiales bacterium]
MASDGAPWLVVGLGNPDDEYAGTRHNAGAMVVARLAERAGAKLKRSRNRAQVAEIRDGDERVVLARPTSYVNESGGPVSLLARWYKTPVERIILVHDEIDLPAGRLQIRRGGGTAGHNGVKDIVKALGSPDFLRVRIGVGRPPGRQDPADYVLEPVPKRQAEDFAVLLERAADAAMDLVHLPLERAQDRHNR